MAVHLIYQVNHGERTLWAAVQDKGQLPMQSLSMWLERNGLPTTKESLEKYHVEYCPVLDWPPSGK